MSFEDPSILISPAFDSWGIHLFLREHRCCVHIGTAFNGIADYGTEADCKRVIDGTVLIGAFANFH